MSSSKIALALEVLATPENRIDFARWRLGPLFDQEKVPTTCGHVAIRHQAIDVLASAIEGLRAEVAELRAEVKQINQKRPSTSAGDYRDWK